MKIMKIFSAFISVIIISFLSQINYPLKEDGIFIVNAKETIDDDYIEGKYIIESPDISANITLCQPAIK